MLLKVKLNAITLLLFASTLAPHHCAAEIAGADGEKADFYQSVFVANDRLSILSAPQTLIQAEPNELKIDIHGGDVRSVLVMWNYYGHAGKAPISASDSETVQISQRADGASYINVSPSVLGKAQMNVQAFFTDGGIASQKITVTVQPSSKNPQKLFMTAGGGDGSSHQFSLHLTSGGTPVGLTPRVIYSDGGKLVPIDPEMVSFTVISSPNEESPINLDTNTGLVTPRRVGHALIISRFSGLVRLTCVIVAPREGAGERPNCHELRPADLQNEPTTDEHRAAPPAIRPH